MVEPDISNWKKLGATSNTQYYEIEPGMLAALPHLGASDDEHSARQNNVFQMDYFREARRSGCVVVLFDRMKGQDAGARRVYQAEPDSKLLLGTALVGGTLLGRAMASFFLGLSKTQVRVKLFGEMKDALHWARSLKRIDGA
jgi:hypothetical protein